MLIRAGKCSTISNALDVSLYLMMPSVVGSMVLVRNDQLLKEFDSGHC